MTPEQMAQEAAAAYSDKTPVSYVLPRPWKNRPKGFPRGELMCENADGTNVWSFDPMRVFAWMAHNGLITVKKDDSKG